MVTWFFHILDPEKCFFFNFSPDRLFQTKPGRSVSPSSTGNSGGPGYLSVDPIPPNEGGGAKKMMHF